MAVCSVCKSSVAYVRGPDGTLVGPLNPSGPEAKPAVGHAFVVQVGGNWRVVMGVRNLETHVCPSEVPSSTRPVPMDDLLADLPPQHPLRASRTAPAPGSEEAPAASSGAVGAEARRAEAALKRRAEARARIMQRSWSSPARLDTLRYACPRCQVPPGEPCHAINLSQAHWFGHGSGLLENPHPERVRVRESRPREMTPAERFMKRRKAPVDSRPRYAPLRYPADLQAGNSGLTSTDLERLRTFLAADPAFFAAPTQVRETQLDGPNGGSRSAGRSPKVGDP